MISANTLQVNNFQKPSITYITLETSGLYTAIFLPSPLCKDSLH